MNPNDVVTVWESVTIATDPRRIDVFESIIVYDIWENKKRYWVGGTGNWDTTAGTKWATSSGGVGGASVPTSSDDVFFDANSIGTITINSTVNCLSFNCTGFTGVLNGTSIMNVYGDYTLSAGMTMSYGGDLYFRSTVTNRLITTNGKNPSTSSKYFDGVGGGWVLQDNFISTGGYSSILLSNGELNTNSKTVTIGNYFQILSGTKTLTLGGSTFTAPQFIMQSTSGFTFNSDTSTLIVQASLAASGLSFYDVEFTMNYGYASLTQLGYTNNFRNLTISNTSSSSLPAEFSNGTTVVSGTFTVSSTSPGFRVLVRSSTVGAPVSIVAATTTLSNCDFSDIAASGTGSWAGTSIGNALGNSGITFTAPVTRYAVGITSTDNWSSTTSWSTSSGGASGASIPICHDTVYLNGSSGSGVLYANTKYLCADLICTGFTGTLYFNTTAYIYGSLTLSSGMTMTTTYDVEFRGRSTHTLTSSGKNFTNGVYFYNYSGTYTLQDGITATTLYGRNGTFDANDYSVSCSNVNFNVTSQFTVYMGSGTWTCSGYDNAWSGTGVNLTVFCETSTIDFTNTSANTKNFSGGSKTYHILKFSGAGIGQYQIAGSNTFDTIISTKTNAYTIMFGAGTTQTVSNFLVSGSAGNIVTLNSSSTSLFNLVKSGAGNVICNYLDISHSYATTTGKWYARNSTNNQSTPTAGSGWIFGEPSFSVSDTVTKTESITSYNSGYNTVKYETVTVSEYLSFRVFTPGAVEPNETIYLYDLPWIWIIDPQGNNRYWVGGSGNWSDPLHWAFTSGGIGGAPMPTPLDDVFIDTNSGLSSGGTISLTRVGSEYWTCMCHDFTSTVGANYTIDYVTSDLSIYGSSIFEKYIYFTSGTWIYFVSNDENNTITTNDVSFYYITFGQDDFGPWPLPLTKTTTYDIYGDVYVYSWIKFQRGTINFNTSNVYYTSDFYIVAYTYQNTSTGYGQYTAVVGDMTINMGSGIWTIYGDFYIEGSDGYYPIINPQTSTLKVTDGNSIEAYNYNNDLEYIGDLYLNNIETTGDHDFYFIGNITANNITLPPSGDSLKRTVFPAEIIGEWNDGSLSVESITSYGAINYPIYISSNYGDFCKVSTPSDSISFDYASISGIKVTDSSDWFVGQHSIDTGGNDGLFFYNKTNLIPDKTVKIFVDGFQLGDASWSNYTTLDNGAVGQSFQASVNTTLDSVHLLLTSFGLVTGTAEVRIYTHTGSYGTTGKATTEIIAVSDPVDVEQFRLPTHGFGYYKIRSIFNFSGVNRIELTSGNYYVAVLVYNNGTASEYLGVAYPSASVPFPGNACTFSLDMNTVTAQPIRDLFISVYGMSDLAEIPNETLTIADEFTVYASDLTNYQLIDEFIEIEENIHMLFPYLSVSVNDTVNIYEDNYQYIVVPGTLITMYDFDIGSMYSLSFNHLLASGNVMVYQGTQLIFDSATQYIKNTYQDIRIREIVKIVIT